MSNPQDPNATPFDMYSYIKGIYDNTSGNLTTGSLNYYGDPPTWQPTIKWKPYNPSDWGITTAPISWNPPPEFTASTIRDICRQVVREELIRMGIVKAETKPSSIVLETPKRKDAPVPLIEHEYIVKFPGGYVKSVRATSAETAKLEAYGRLQAAGHSVEDLSPADGTATEL